MTPASRPAQPLPPRRRRRFGLVLPFLLAVGAVLGVGAAAYSRGVTGGGSGHPNAASHAAKAVPAGQAPTAPAPAAPPVDLKSLDVKIGKLMLTTDNTGVTQTSLPVSVTNTGGLTHSFDITIVAVDPNGNRITTDTGTAANLRPGQTAQLRVLEIVNDALVRALTTATFQVQSVFTY
jgi:hypothetical protein